MANRREQTSLTNIILDDERTSQKNLQTRLEKVIMYVLNNAH